MSSGSRVPRPIHADPHPAAERSGVVKSGIFAGPVLIFDWFDRMAERSWMLSDHPAVMIYACRRENLKLPFDDDVVLVRTDGGVHALVHVDELAEAGIDEALS